VASTPIFALRLMIEVRKRGRADIQGRESGGCLWQRKDPFMVSKLLASRMPTVIVKTLSGLQQPLIWNLSLKASRGESLKYHRTM
jgi:hypothetical protein